MDNRTLLRTGIAGSVVAALCCATPILVILFGVLGLSAWVGWLGYVLISPLVGVFAISIYALPRRRLGGRHQAENRSDRQRRRGHGGGAQGRRERRRSHADRARRDRRHLRQHRLRAVEDFHSRRPRRPSAPRKPVRR